jgi:hypothetical protein
MGEQDVKLPSFLTLEIDKNEQSTSRSSRFTSGKAPLTIE